LPEPGNYYIFPAWQPHSVMPFRGEGERWSLAFNAVALPQAATSTPAIANQVQGNVSLSIGRDKPSGFG